MPLSEPTVPHIQTVNEQKSIPHVLNYFLSTRFTPTAERLEITFGQN